MQERQTYEQKVELYKIEMGIYNLYLQVEKSLEQENSSGNALDLLRELASESPPYELINLNPDPESNSFRGGVYKKKSPKQISKERKQSHLTAGLYSYKKLNTKPSSYTRETTAIAQYYLGLVRLKQRQAFSAFPMLVAAASQSVSSWADRALDTLKAEVSRFKPFVEVVFERCNLSNSIYNKTNFSVTPQKLATNHYFPREVFAYCRLLANANIAEYQYYYSQLLLTGLGVRQNIDESDRYLTLASEGGCYRAMNTLACKLLILNSDAKCVERRANYLDAQVLLAEALLRVDASIPNLLERTEAKILIRFNLARANHRLATVGETDEKMYSYFKSAIELYVEVSNIKLETTQQTQEYIARAKNDFAVMLFDIFERKEMRKKLTSEEVLGLAIECKIERLLDDAVKEGSVDALYHLGRYHIDVCAKRSPTSRMAEYETAIRYFRRAAACGHTKAQQQLGFFLDNPKITKQYDYLAANEEEAVNFYFSAMLANDPLAINNLNFIWDPEQVNQAHKEIKYSSFFARSGQSGGEVFGAVGGVAVGIVAGMWTGTSLSAGQLWIALGSTIYGCYRGINIGRQGGGWFGERCGNLLGHYVGKLKGKADAWGRMPAAKEKHLLILTFLDFLHILKPECQTEFIRRIIENYHVHVFKSDESVDLYNTLQESSISMDEKFTKIRNYLNELKIFNLGKSSRIISLKNGGKIMYNAIEKSMIDFTQVLEKIFSCYRANDEAKLEEALREIQNNYTISFKFSSRPSAYVYNQMRTLLSSYDGMGKNLKEFGEKAVEHLLCGLFSEQSIRFKADILSSLKDFKSEQQFTYLEFHSLCEELSLNGSRAVNLELTNSSAASRPMVSQGLG